MHTKRSRYINFDPFWAQCHPALVVSPLCIKRPSYGHKVPRHWYLPGLSSACFWMHPMMGVGIFDLMLASYTLQIMLQTFCSFKARVMSTLNLLQENPIFNIAIQMLLRLNFVVNERMCAAIGNCSLLAQKGTEVSKRHRIPILRHPPLQIVFGSDASCSPFSTDE